MPRTLDEAGVIRGVSAAVWERMRRLFLTLLVKALAGMPSDRS